MLNVAHEGKTPQLQSRGSGWSPLATEKAADRSVQSTTPHSVRNPLQRLTRARVLK
jgi:hypothetical protein